MRGGCERAVDYRVCPDPSSYPKEFRVVGQFESTEDAGRFLRSLARPGAPRLDQCDDSKHDQRHDADQEGDPRNI
jgi:hypothetical protein